MEESKVTLEDIELSLATLIDADTVGTIKNVQWAEIHGSSIPTLEYSKENARKYFMSLSNTYYFAKIKDTGKIVGGSGYSTWFCPFYYNRQNILAAYTDKELRRSGLSSYLQLKCLQGIHEQNGCYVEALIHRDNTASNNSAYKTAQYSGFDILKVRDIKAIHYGSYPELPASWVDFLATFEKNFQNKTRFFKDIQNQRKNDLQIIWHFDQDYDRVFEQSKNLDWSKSINTIQRENFAVLSNRKLEIFNGRLKSVKGSSDYDNQALGFILEDNQIQGIVYLSNYLHIGLGTRFLALSEITLFEPKLIEKNLPQIIKSIHFDLAKRYLIYILMVPMPEEDNPFREIYQQILSELGLVDYSCRVFSQTRPYKIQEEEKL